MWTIKIIYAKYKKEVYFYIIQSMLSVIKHINATTEEISKKKNSFLHNIIGRSNLSFSCLEIP